VKQIKRLSWFSLLFVIFLFPVNQAEAGVWDRIKDIYTAPEKVEELKDIYTDSMQKLDEQREQLQGQLEAQREQLEESRRQAEELLNRQADLEQLNASYMQENELYKQESELYRQESDMYRKQNEELAAQNQQLLQRMQQIEEDRKAWIRNIVLTVGGLILLFLAYAASIRIWRYLVWRRQGKVLQSHDNLMVEHRMDAARHSQDEHNGERLP
jgi:Skp family chaperone for outer membrane proteins